MKKGNSQYTVSSIVFASTLLWGCAFHSNDPAASSEIKSIPTPIIEPSVEIESQASANFTDSSGKKQGLWKSYLYGKLWKIEYFKDGQLHCICKEYKSDGIISQTTYKLGQKDGLFMEYHPDSAAAHYAAYYTKDTHIWSAFPWELGSYIVPVKGFHTSLDTAKIEVPYISGARIYEGRIVAKNGRKGEAFGIHRAYYETGKIKAIVDYDLKRISVFNLDGSIYKESTISNWKGNKLPDI